MRATCHWQLSDRSNHSLSLQAVLRGGVQVGIPGSEGEQAVASPAPPTPLPRCQATRPEHAQLLQSPWAAFLLQPGLKVKDQLGCFVILFQ